MDLMKKAILEAVPTSKGYLIDGLPRELGQAKIFEEEVSSIFIFQCLFFIYYEMLKKKKQCEQYVEDVV